MNLKQSMIALALLGSSLTGVAMEQAAFANNVEMARFDKDLVNGWSVKKVLYPSGAFVQLSAKEWVENNRDGTHRFKEQLRDEWSVYLKSVDRPVFIQLDLWTEEVKYRGPNIDEQIVLYPITHAE